MNVYIHSEGRINDAKNNSGGYSRMEYDHHHYNFTFFGELEILRWKDRTGYPVASLARAYVDIPIDHGPRKSGFDETVTRRRHQTANQYYRRWFLDPVEAKNHFIDLSIPHFYPRLNRSLRSPGGIQINPYSEAVKLDQDLVRRLFTVFVSNTCGNMGLRQSPNLVHSETGIFRVGKDKTNRPVMVAV